MNDSLLETCRVEDWNKLNALLVAADDEAVENGLAALARADARCGLAENFHTAKLALAGSPVDLIVVAAEGANEKELLHFIDQLHAYTTDTDTKVVASVSFGQLDTVAGNLLHLGATVVCDASVNEFADAIVRTASSRVGTVRDIGSDRAHTLAQLHDDMQKCAETIRSLVADSMPSPMPTNEHTTTPTNPATVRAMLRARRLRANFFDGDWFADPAWDMLLDLYAAHLEGRNNVCVSSLCIAAATPPTTALRWITTMTDAGLLCRRADPQDRRRHIMSLTDRSLSALENYFAALPPSPTV